MQTTPNEPTYSLSNSDREELNKLVSVLELSDSTMTIFAIAPESGPQHPVVEELKSLLSESEERFQFQNFFYSDNSLHNFLYGLDDEVRSPQPPSKRAIESRLLVMAFGIDQLPTPRLVREMKQLNLGRDSLFQRKLVLIFWLNKVEFLDEFRNRAPDFWDWRGKVVQFEARPVFNPLFYPYLEWLIAENSYLKISGVMQVQRQVDIFLDQIYVSLQAVRRQQVTDTSERGHRELEMMTSRHVGKGRRGASALDEFELLDEVEPLVPDFVPSGVSTKTVTQKVDLSQAVRENQYCVILGAPGAGKTTLLRYLALHFGMAKRDGMEVVAGGEGQEELGKPLLPVFFRIADYAERLAQEPDLSLLEYLRQFYRQWEVYFENSSSSHAQGYVSPPSPPILGGTGIQNSSILGETGVQSPPEARPQDTAFCPPNPPILGGTGVQNSSALEGTGIQSSPVSPELRETKIQSPPELGDLGGNAHPDLPPQPPLLRGELELEGGGNSDVPQLLCEQMRQGQCLMLLDGLDEVFSQESRRLIVERINQFVEQFSANKFVVTSRIAGYRDVKLSERFAEFTIEDMGSEQVEGFLHRWCRAVEKAQQPDASEEQWQRVGDEQTREILAAIQANEGVKRLTANPLLLTILALIHRNGSRLPHRRVELYALAVKTLTEDWQLGKKLPDAPKVMLKESEVVELLAPLAYWMHEEKPSGVVSQEEAEERLAAILAELNDDEPESESVRQAVEQFLRKVRETTGLFVERAPGVYGFMHLTFEEYFAARYIADHEMSDMLEIIRKHLHEVRWHEPILLALGYWRIHSPMQLNKLVERLFEDIIQFTNSLDFRWINLLLNLLSKFSFAQRGFPRKIAVFIQIFSLSIVLIFSKQIPTFSTEYLIFACQVITELEIHRKFFYKIIKSIALVSIFWSREQNEIEIDKTLVKFQALKKIIDDFQKNYLINTTDFLEFIKQNNLNEIRANLLIYLRELAVDIKLPKLIRNRSQILLVNIAAGKEDFNLDEYELNNHSLLPNEDLGLIYQIAGYNYQKKSKYKQAIAHFQQSRELYEQLGQEKNVADQWNWLATCYREWGKYEQAVECQQQHLLLCQKLKNQPRIANVYDKLGHIYQDWGKYEQAVNYFQQSRNLYQQIGQDKNAAWRWNCLSGCYQEWGKYEQSVECELKNLAIWQQLDDQENIAYAYYQLGCIYQAWGKYAQAIAHFQHSRELYEQLGKEKDVANQWAWLAYCYKEWGKYQQAEECELKNLAICQQLENQPNTASAYGQLGHIYQAWGKYEQAIAHYQQSRELYEQLGKEKNVANQWYYLAGCYRDWGKYQQAVECELKDLAIREKLDDQLNIADAYNQLGRIYQAWGKYEQAIAHHQHSRELYEQLGKEKEVANQWYWLAVCYREWGKYQQAEAFNLLTQAEQNIRQAIQINTASDYKGNLAYDYTALGLLYSERLRLLPPDDPSLPEQIAQFEDYYNTGLTYLTELGQTVNRAEETLDMARAYLEVNALENLDQAEALAQESLQIFQDYNRRKLEAAARKLLGEIYLKRAQRNQPNAETTAHQFLSESLQLYRELDLTEKAAEVEQLMQAIADDTEQT